MNAFAVHTMAEAGMASRDAWAQLARPADRARAGFAPLVSCGTRKSSDQGVVGIHGVPAP